MPSRASRRSPRKRHAEALGARAVRRAGRRDALRRGIQDRIRRRPRRARSAHRTGRRISPIPSPRKFTFSEIVTPDAGYVIGVESNGRNAQSHASNPPAHSMSGLRLAAVQREYAPRPSGGAAARDARQSRSRAAGGRHRRRPDDVSRGALRRCERHALHRRIRSRNRAAGARCARSTTTTSGAM